MITIRAIWYAVLGIALLAVPPAIGLLAGNAFVTGMLTGLVITPALIVAGFVRQWHRVEQANVACGGER